MRMIQTMRWFGPEDIVSLADIRQAGCSGVVTALHHIPIGEIWTMEEIQKRKNIIEQAGLSWTVVESLPVHDEIKRRTCNFEKLIANYCESLTHLAACGIKVVTYNFMPVLDWIRTDLKFKTPTGAFALKFEKSAFIAFDLYLLKRDKAFEEYSDEEIYKAKRYFEQLEDSAKDTLMRNCLQALPGSKEEFKPENLLAALKQYNTVTRDDLRSNLIEFLRGVTPTADELELQLAIHPDDPPYPILGLPRVMSTEADFKYIAGKVPAKSNGLCFCSGSFGARADNDLPGIIKRHGNRIFFLHLRSTQRDDEGNFFEASHLEGDADMFTLVKEIIDLMNTENRSIPMRPDHGHQMLDDINKSPYPGYSAIGRLKGMAELRGLELGIRKSLNL